MNPEHFSAENRHGFGRFPIWRDIFSNTLLPRSTAPFYWALNCHFVTFDGNGETHCDAQCTITLGRAFAVPPERFWQCADTVGQATIAPHPFCPLRSSCALLVAAWYAQIGQCLQVCRTLLPLNGQLLGASGFSLLTVVCSGNWNCYLQRVGNFSLATVVFTSGRF